MLAPPWWEGNAGVGRVLAGFRFWVGNLFRGALVGALRCDDKVFDDEADSCGCDSTYPKTDLREQNKGTAVFAQMAIPDRFVPSERDGPSNDLAEPNDWHFDRDPNEREQDCTEYFNPDYAVE